LDKINPFNWSLNHQFAGAIVCVLGAIGGILFAWMESPFRQVAMANLSGEWSDYTSVFLTWLRFGRYWVWPVLGAVIAGLAVYSVQLLRTPN
jgi:hypothetical protein